MSGTIVRMVLVPASMALLTSTLFAGVLGAFLQPDVYADFVAGAVELVARRAGLREHLPPGLGVARERDWQIEEAERFVRQLLAQAEGALLTQTRSEGGLHSQRAQQGGVGALEGVVLMNHHPEVREPIADTRSQLVQHGNAAGLDDGVGVTGYAMVRSGGMASSDDLWQFCLVGPDGRWVTYGDLSTLQAVGDAEQDACSFTGEPHPEPPLFDVRRLAQDLYDAMEDDSSGDEPSLAVWGNGRTAGSNPKLRALVQEWLPAGWVTSRVDQRGWSAVQYCLTAPSGEWYYVRHSTIGGYDDTGRCRLDPDLPSVG